MTYLEEAAEQIRKAIAGNEKRAEQAEEMQGALPARAAGMLQEVNALRAGYAAAFTRLAAIEAGLPPCPGHDAREDQQ